MAKDLTIAQEGVGTDVEISFSGDTGYMLIPGAENVDAPTGTAESTTSQNFKQEFQSTGGIPPGQITVAVDPWVSLHPTVQRIYDAADDKSTVWLRWTTPQEELLGVDASRTAAVAITTGAVTFAGTEGSDVQEARWTEEEFSAGLALRIGGKLYPVASIADDGKLVVVDGETFAAPTQAVAAAQYSIVRPGTRRKAACRIANISTTTPSAGHETGTIQFNPKTSVQKPVPVYE